MRIICFLVCVCSSTSTLAQNPFQTPPEHLNIVEDAVNVIALFEQGLRIVILAPGAANHSWTAETPADNIGAMTTTVLRSAGGHFNPAIAVESGIEFDSFSDINTEHTFSKLTPYPNAQYVWDFNSGYYTGDLETDLTWSGSLYPGGSWADAPGGGPYLHIAPEPSAVSMLIVAMLFVATRRR